MKKSYGKQFEKDFKNSIPEGVWINKFKDGGGWSNADNTRFTVNNICDFEVYNPYNKQLFYFELKHTNLKSLPFVNIKDNQIKGLTKATQYGIICGFLISINNKCYFLNINHYNSFVAVTERKSIPLSYIEDFGIDVPRRKLRVNYRYDLNNLLKRVIE